MCEITDEWCNNLWASQRSSPDFCKKCCLESPRDPYVGRRVLGGAHCLGRVLLSWTSCSSQRRRRADALARSVHSRRLACKRAIFLPLQRILRVFFFQGSLPIASTPEAWSDQRIAITWGSQLLLELDEKEIRRVEIVARFPRRLLVANLTRTRLCYTNVYELLSVLQL